MRFCTNAERKKRGTVGWEGEALLIMVRVVLVVVVIKERKPALLRLLPEGLLSLLNSGQRGKGPRLGKVAALTGDAALLGCVIRKNAIGGDRTSGKSEGA